MCVCACVCVCVNSLYRFVPSFFVQVILCTGLCLHALYGSMSSFIVQVYVFILCTGLSLHFLYRSVSSFFVQVCVFILCTPAGTWRDRHEQCCFLNHKGHVCFNSRQFFSLRKHKALTVTATYIVHVACLLLPNVSMVRPVRRMKEQTCTKN